MCWWKFAKFLMSFSKPQASFSLNFAWLFSVIKDESSVLFLVKRYLLCTNRAQSKFWRLECWNQNSPNSCHFWNSKLFFLQVLHHSPVSWDIAPLYFFSWNFIYFQQKEPIKVQIWWNFIWVAESLKFSTLMGSHCKNHITV